MKIQKKKGWKKDIRRNFPFNNNCPHPRKNNPSAKGQSIVQCLKWKNRPWEKTMHCQKWKMLRKKRNHTHQSGINRNNLVLLGGWVRFFLVLHTNTVEETPKTWVVDNFSSSKADCYTAPLFLFLFPKQNQKNPPQTIPCSFMSYLPRPFTWVQHT